MHPHSWPLFDANNAPFALKLTLPLMIQWPLSSCPGTLVDRKHHREMSHCDWRAGRCVLQLAVLASPNWRVVYSLWPSVLALCLSTEKEMAVLFISRRWSCWSSTASPVQSVPLAISHLISPPLRLPSCCAYSCLLLPLIPCGEQWNLLPSGRLWWYRMVDLSGFLRRSISHLVPRRPLLFRYIRFSFWRRTTPKLREQRRYLLPRHREIEHFTGRLTVE